jgi:hypothetical protein
MQTTKRWPAMTAVGIGALALTVPAAQAVVPGVATGGANGVTANAAQLRGAVNPKSRPTTYYFEYGLTRRYGSRTPDANAGRGAKSANVAAAVGGLQANTTYHYRLVASNPDGVTSGSDRAFTTKKQPLGLAFVATPNPITFGGGANLAGQLTGTGNSGQQVLLQQRAFPYTTGFANLGNAVVTDVNGAFAFGAMALPATTQLRVQTTDGKVTSPIATVAVAVRVKTNISKTSVKRGGLVRFSGTIRPAREGALYAIQKLGSRGQWVTVAGGVTRKGGTAFSGFSRRVRVRRGGQFRVFVRIVDGNYTSGIGRTITLRATR